MSNKITPKEALYGYISWLSCRKDISKIGAGANCAPLIDRLTSFEAYNPDVLGEITGAYPGNFMSPSVAWLTPSHPWYFAEARIRVKARNLRRKLRNWWRYYDFS